MELDFIIASKNDIDIVEVKSGKRYKTHASLDAIHKMVQGNLDRRIVLSKYNVEVSENGIIYLPLYMSMFI